MSDMTQIENAVKAAVGTDERSLEARVTAIELTTQTWYEKHLPLLAGVAGLVVGVLAGHFIRL
jgi:hypothetical protein